MLKDGETKVGKYTVPVCNAKFISLVYFSAGARGNKERGQFAFWTAVLKRKKKNRVWGRSRPILPAGDRFDRMKREKLKAKSKSDRKAYGRMWDVMGRGRNIRYIRPSTLAEIQKWFKSHASDAKYAYGVSVRGKYYAVKHK